MTTIVVGIDDSPGAAAALRWAVDEARLREATLRVVHAWDWPYEGHLGTLADEILERKTFAEAAAKVLATMVQEVLGDQSADIALEEHVAEGSAAHVLLEAAAEADLLVVGSRGRGGFQGLLLGSVSQQCAHHARSPVVIVRAERA